MIYVATDADGAVKIGDSKNPERRCRRLDATLIRTFDLPLSVEERFHKELRYLFLPVRTKQRSWQAGRIGGAPHSGEWYQPQGFIEGGVIETLPFVLAMLEWLEESFSLPWSEEEITTEEADHVQGEL